jgi:beta-glucanase (GH16 family)
VGSAVTIYTVAVARGRLCGSNDMKHSQTISPRRRDRSLISAVALGSAVVLAAAGCGSAAQTPSAAASASTAASSPALVTAAPPAGFTLLWRDDFEGSAGTAPSVANWKYDVGPGSGFGTGEQETMTSNLANVQLDGSGHLAITPIRSGVNDWTSGRIETLRSDFEAPAGGILRVEGSLQQPNVTAVDGMGYWPAFWMLGAPLRSGGSWPGVGEIDLMEDINGRSSEYGTLHCGTAPGGPCNENSGIGSGELPCPGCQTSFHTYAIEHDRSKTPEELRWYLDGKQIFAVQSTRVDEATWTNAMHHGFFVILNVAMGGGFPAALGGVLLPSTASGRPMLVDYVAVYTKPAP